MHHDTALVLQVVLQAEAARTAPDPPTHPPKDPPCTAVQQHVQQQCVTTLNAEVVAASLMFLGSSAGDGSCRRSPHVELGVRKYGTTAATVLQQKQHVHHTTHRPIHQRPTNYHSAARRTAAVLETVHAERGWVAVRYWGSPCYYDPVPYRGPDTAPFNAPRWSRLPLGHVLSPMGPCAVWGGRGALVRQQAVAWLPGEQFRKGA